MVGMGGNIPRSALTAPEGNAVDLAASAEEGDYIPRIELAPMPAGPACHLQQRTQPHQIGNRSKVQGSHPRKHGRRAAKSLEQNKNLGYAPASIEEHLLDV
jgi:hypothetical protein